MKKICFLAPRLILVAFFMSIILVIVLENFELFEPYLYPLHMAQGKIVSYGSTITIGHYPSAGDLERLKARRRIDIDISLLNPQLPQEKALDRQLAARTRKLGIELKTFPMNYSDIDGPENRKTIADLVTYIKNNHSKRVYIHCYLGRHRVALVKKELARQHLITDDMETGSAGGGSD